jgi:hypothetical protein
MDVRAFRGANTDSDHFLVVPTKRSTICKVKNGSVQPDCGKLKLPKTAREYEINWRI